MENYFLELVGHDLFCMSCIDGAICLCVACSASMVPDSPLFVMHVCLFDTLLFELDREIVDRFKLVWLIFWTAADRMVSSSTMDYTGLLAEIPLVTGICAVEFEPPNLVVWGPEIL